MKTKLFDHNDLDAMGCAILSKLSFDEVDVEYCDYENINEKVKEFIDNKKYLNYDHIYITDISISNELAEYITNFHPEEFENGFNLCESFTLIDHHATAEYLNKYWWCNVTVSIDNELCCGTSLFYEEIKQLFKKTRLVKKNIKEFINLVQAYDTWSWQKTNNISAVQLNDLLKMYGRDRFIDKMINKLKTETTFKFDDIDLLLLQLDKEKKDKYFENKNKQLVTIDITIDNNNYTVGVIFAENYISEAGNYLAEQNPQLDFIVLVNDSISFRGIKDNIDLGKIAEKLNGGGHKSASGCVLDKNKLKEFFISLFE